MKYTPNLQLNKPDIGDQYNIEHFNGNADKLDTAITSNKTAIAAETTARVSADTTLQSNIDIIIRPTVITNDTTIANIGSDRKFIITGGSLTLGVGAYKQCSVTVFSEINSSIKQAGVTPYPIKANELVTLDWDGARWINYKLKQEKETSMPAGTIFPSAAQIPSVKWNPADPDSYSPYICLTDIAQDSYRDITIAEAPDLAPSLLKLTTPYSITGYTAVAGGIVNFFIDRLFVLRLINDHLYHTVQAANRRYLKVAEQIGDVPIGLYLIVTIDSLNGILGVKLPSVTSSWTGSATVYFNSHLNSNSPNSARLFSMRGQGFMGEGDQWGYFGDGLARRGHFQGHGHNIFTIDQYGGSGGSSRYVPSGMYSAGVGVDEINSIRLPNGSGGYGNPRFAQETTAPATAVKLYMHVGRWL